MVCVSVCVCSVCVCVQKESFFTVGCPRDPDFLAHTAIVNQLRVLQGSTRVIWLNSALITGAVQCDISHRFMVQCCSSGRGVLTPDTCGFNVHWAALPPTQRDITRFHRTQRPSNLTCVLAGGQCGSHRRCYRALLVFNGS